MMEWGWKFWLRVTGGETPLAPPAPRRGSYGEPVVCFDFFTAEARRDAELGLRRWGFGTTNFTNF